MDVLETPEFPELPCAGGCGQPTRAVVLYDQVFPQLCPACLEGRDAEDAAAQRAARAEELLGQVRVGGAIRAWSVRSYPADDEQGRGALRAGLAWLESFRAGDRHGLLIHGPVGTGKTGLAWSLARELIEVDLVAANMVNFRDALAEIVESFGTSGSEMPFRKAEVLFLDDLGAERPTDFARDKLAQLIEWRYTRGLVTCATSNYRLSELGARLGHDDPVVGQRIVSRLNDGAVQIRVEGMDRRA